MTALGGGKPKPAAESTPTTAAAAPTPAAATTRSPSPRPTTRAPTKGTQSPTRSQREQAQRYVNALLPKLQAESQAFSEFADTCDPSNLQTCRAGLEKVHTANTDLANTLRANEAPACLREADSELHAATSLIDQAMHNGTSGIDQNDPLLVLKAVEQIDEASTHLTRAGELMENSAC